MMSLRTRLFLILVAATSVIWLFAIGWIYAGTRHEVEGVLDARLQEAARMVASLVPTKGVATPEASQDALAEIPIYERQLSCQIWSLDGRLVARSSGAPSSRLSDTKGGFSERDIDGDIWRVFTVEDADKGIRVLVGDRVGIREHLVADIIKGLLTPTLLIIPLIGLLIWSSLNRGLRPLRRLARELQTRGADDMSPVQPGRAPAEILPMVAALNGLFEKVESAAARARAHGVCGPRAAHAAGGPSNASAGCHRRERSGGAGARVAADPDRGRSHHAPGAAIARDGQSRRAPRRASRRHRQSRLRHRRDRRHRSEP